MAEERNGQTAEEVQAIFAELGPHGLVFTKYEITAHTPEGNELKIKYDIQNDSRFKEV